MNKFRSLVVATLVGVGAAVAGCGGGGGEAVVVVGDRTGTLTLHWSVDGTFEPGACDAFGAANARIDLYDINGAPISTTFVDCRAFAASFELAEGQYSARIEMVDPAGVSRSTSVAIPPFTVLAGTNLNIDSDFPANSFF